MARNYAALPYEYKREMSALNDAEFGRLCRALIDYSELGTPIAPSGNERFYAERVMMQEDRFKESYNTTASRNRANGASGGRPPSKPSVTQENPSKPSVTQKTETESETKTDVTVVTDSISSSAKASELIGATPVAHGDLSAIVSAWNSLNLTPIRGIKPESTRYKLLKTRIHDYGAKAVLEAIENIRSSPFLKGQNKKGWVISFDWFIKPNNFVKVLEGNYAPRDSKQSGAGETRKSWSEIAAEMEGRS